MELQELVTKMELVDLIQLLMEQLLMAAEAAEAVVQALVSLEVLVEAVLLRVAVQPLAQAPLALAGKADNLGAVDTVDNQVADMDRPLVGAAVGKLGLGLVEVPHEMHHPQAWQGVAVQQLGSDATCCHNLYNERFSPSVPIDWERGYIALRRLGRK